MRPLPMEFRVGFAQRLREAVQRQGYSVARFSELSGYSENRIHKWLAGAVPELPEVMVLAQWLKVSPGWLLFGESQELALSKRRAVKVLGVLIGIGLLVGNVWASETDLAQGLVQDGGKILLIGHWQRVLAHRMHQQRGYARPHRDFRSRLALAA